MEAKVNIEQLKAEQFAFLAKCENLAQQIITIPLRTDSDKPLDKLSYLIFESDVLTLREQLNKKWQDQVEETYILLRNQYTTFTMVHNLSVQYVVESVITK